MSCFIFFLKYFVSYSLLVRLNDCFGPYNFTQISFCLCTLSRLILLHVLLFWCNPIMSIGSRKKNLIWLTWHKLGALFLFGQCFFFFLTRIFFYLANVRRMREDTHTHGYHGDFNPGPLGSTSKAN